MANSYAKILEALVPRDEEIIRNIGAAIIFGTVKSVDPLIINVENRIELDESFFVLSPFCKTYSVKVEQTYMSTTNGNHTHTVSHEGTHTTTSNGDHTHNTTVTMRIRLWRGLKEGDIVNMIMSSDKQKYYIINYQDLEVGEIDDDSANIE